MTRPARVAIAIAVLAAFQVAAYLVYRAVERARAPRAPAARFEGETLRGAEAAPLLDGTRADGSAVAITWPSDRIRVVHFWATWCKPCRTELPGLLALARGLRDDGIDLVAVAVDDSWSDIRAFFDGDVPPEVMVTTDPEVHKRFGVSTLPDTYVVDRTGNLVERFHGARDWRAAAAREHLRALVAH
ncbi:MAG: TlpA family protein disulfide reductase [Kofleriaceae bacterium]|nr:MAG: TlpA family protein disulfide reductase [Kofleriaceae bacterium]MBZ0233070.1 TlpA family protein disulfide reductase [Kofleriaceae bacterium]